MATSTVIRVLPAGEAVVVAVAGELDALNAQELEGALRRVIDEGTRLVAVDLCETTFIESRGIGVLMRGARELRRRLGHLTIACADSKVLRLAELVRLEDVAACYPDREQALEALLAYA